MGVHQSVSMYQSYTGSKLYPPPPPTHLHFMFCEVLVSVHVTACVHVCCDTGVTLITIIYDKYWNVSDFKHSVPILDNVTGSNRCDTFSMKLNSTIQNVLKFVVDVHISFKRRKLVKVFILANGHKWYDYWNLHLSLIWYDLCLWLAY